MQISRAKIDEHSTHDFASDRAALLVRLGLRLTWDVVRLPLLTLLVILEPLVQFSLSACALLLTMTALFFRFLVHRPDFPFWGMLALSIGCVWVLALYYACIRLLGLRVGANPGRPAA